MWCIVTKGSPYIDQNNTVCRRSCRVDRAKFPPIDIQVLEGKQVLQDLGS